MNLEEELKKDLEVIRTRVIAARCRSSLFDTVTLRLRQLALTSLDHLAVPPAKLTSQVRPANERAPAHEGEPASGTNLAPQPNIDTANDPGFTVVAAASGQDNTLTQILADGSEEYRDNLVC